MELIGILLLENAKRKYQNTERMLCIRVEENDR